MLDDGTASTTLLLSSHDGGSIECMGGIEICESQDTAPGDNDATEAGSAANILDLTTSILKSIRGTLERFSRFGSPRASAESLIICSPFYRMSGWKAWVGYYVLRENLVDNRMCAVKQFITTLSLYSEKRKNRDAITNIASKIGHSWYANQNGNNLHNALCSAVVMVLDLEGLERHGKEDSLTSVVWCCHN